MKNSHRGFLARLADWSFVLALCVLLPTPARADVLVTHAPDFAGDRGYLSNIGAGFQNADFTFGGNANVKGITWWGSTLSVTDLALFTVRMLSGLNQPDHVIELIANSSNLTQASACSPGASNDDPCQRYSRFDLDLSTSPLLLGSGSFYLSIMNESTDDPGWAWLLGTGGDGINQFRFNDNQPWQDSSNGDGDFALELTGTRTAVPEPGTTALLLLAGAALLVTRRRAQRQ